MFNASDDPLGLALAQRARDSRRMFNANADANDAASVASGVMPIQAQMASKYERGRSDAMSQGYNSDWDKFFQSLQEQKDAAEASGMKFKVDTRAMGNPSMASLNDSMLPPMPESQEKWSARTRKQIYGPSMDSLNRGR